MNASVFENASKLGKSFNWNDNRTDCFKERFCYSIPLEIAYNATSSISFEEV